jgi:hypothetical protein
MGFAMCVVNLGIVRVITSATKRRRSEYFIRKDS